MTNLETITEPNKSIIAQDYFKRNALFNNILDVIITDINHIKKLVTYF